MNLSVSLSVWGLCGGFDVPTHHRTDHDRATLSNDYNSRKVSVDSSVSNNSSEFSDINFADSTRDDLSTCSSDSYSSSGSSTDGVAVVAGDGSALCENVVRKITQSKQPLRVEIKLLLCNNKFTLWETVLNPLNNTLYIAIPPNFAPELSKHSFLSLLEFAETKLDVDAVVLIMKKQQPNRSKLAKTFLVLGFHQLEKESPYVPTYTNIDDCMLFIYNIEE